MTDLQGKFTALESALGGKLDTVIERLDALITGVNAVNDSVLSQSEVDLSAVIGRLDISQSIAGSANALLTDIRSAIGVISSYPANYTVRHLLALLQESLESAPPVIINPADLPDCATGMSANWVQCTGMNYLGLGAYNGSDYKVYSPEFGSSLEQYTLQGLYNAGNLRTVYRHLGSSFGDVTVAYKYTSDVMPWYILKSERTYTTTQDSWPTYNYNTLMLVKSNIMVAGCSSSNLSGVQASPIGAGDVVVEYFLLFPQAYNLDLPLTMFLASATVGS
jgi:hypothetical protein